MRQMGLDMIYAWRTINIKVFVELQQQISVQSVQQKGFKWKRNTLSQK